MTVIYKTIDLNHNLQDKWLAHIKIINIITDCITICQKSNHSYNYMSKYELWFVISQSMFSN